MKIRWIVLVGMFLVVAPYFCTAQPTRADSLRSVLAGQDGIDRIETLHLLFGTLVNRAQDSALLHAREAWHLSQTADPLLHGQSIMNLTHAYFVNGHIDSCKQLLKTSLSFYNEHEIYDKVAAVYRNLAVMGEVEDQPDTSLYYLDQCLAVLSEHPDSITLGDVWLSKGFAYRTKGYYELSIDALLKSLRIFEQIGQANRMGYAAQNLGWTMLLADRLEQALDRMEASIDYFSKVENDRAIAQSLNNIGLISTQLGQFDRAKASHLESIRLAEQTAQPDVILDNYYNLVKSSWQQGQWDSCRYWMQQADELATQLDVAFVRGGVARYQARLELKENRSNPARQAVFRAESFLDHYPDPVERQEAFEELAEIHEALDQPARALAYFRQAQTIEDSLFTTKKDRQIEELTLIYETEKKDAAIAFLEQESELDQVRKRNLWGGILFLLVAAGLVIYMQKLRRKKDRIIHAREREVEIQRRRQAEQELYFKKKELVAKALQLARKNEFLDQLQAEIKDIKSSVDEKVNRSSRRISRMITNDVQDEEEWDQFMQEFISVHEGFFDKMIEKHGSMSKNEVRLISLLKMNLSSKDIAGSLRISYDGVKKARYRLRKKLGLESDTDLQEYLLSFDG